MPNKLEACITYCEQQNGQPFCKNCGLDREMIKEERKQARHEAIAEVRLEIDKTPSYWRHPMALFPKYRTCQGDLKEMKTKDDILATLTKLQGDE